MCMYCILKRLNTYRQTVYFRELDYLHMNLELNLHRSILKLGATLKESSLVHARVLRDYISKEGLAFFTGI